MASSTSGVAVIDAAVASGTRVEMASSTALDGLEIERVVSPRSEETAEIAAVAVVVTAVIMDSSSAFSRSASPLKSGKKRVHQNMRRTLRSMTRRLKTNATTRRKKQRPPRMRRRSSQSDFSRAVIRSFEVLMRSERVSCCPVAARKLRVDCSVG